MPYTSVHGYVDIYSDVYAGENLAEIVWEIGFTADPLDPLGSVVWTAITQDVEKEDHFRGKQHELDRTEPGTGELLLNNRTRKYDPSNAASPYYPNLTPRRRARKRLVWAGVSYTVWTGYTRSWSPKWPDEANSDTVLELVDQLQMLNMASMATLNTLYEDTVVADGATTYYRLGDAPGSVIAVDAVAGANGTYLQTCVLGQPGAILSESDTAVDFGHDAGMLAIPNAVMPTGTEDCSFECWVKLAGEFTRPFDVGTLIASVHTSGTVGLSFNFSNPNAPAFQCGVSNVAGQYASSAQSIADGNYHHVVGTRQGIGGGNQTAVLYVDGVPIASSTGALFTIDTLFDLGIAGFISSGPLMFGLLDEVAVYRGTALTADQVLNHYELGARMWAGQTTGERVNAVLDLMGVADADRDVDPGATVCAPITSPFAATSTPLSHVQDCALTEAGFLFAAGNGQLTFHDRAYVINGDGQPIQAVFGEDVGELHYMPGLDAAEDDLDLYSDCLAQRNGGAPQMFFDQAARDEWGQSCLSLGGLLSDSDMDVYARCQWEVFLRSTPQERMRSFTVTPEQDPENLWPIVGALELDQRVQLYRRPVGGGAPWVALWQIEGIKHSYTPPGLYQVTYNLVPADLTDWFILNTSELGSALLGY